MPIKERLREVRKTVGLTHAKFAQRIAVSTGYLAGMELGDKKINERAIKLICTEFNVDATWFRTGEGEMFNKDSDVRIAQMISLFKSLNSNFQDCALKQLNDLAEVYCKLKL
jgi:transcriptional regulator with XRE-family HTH domain